MGTTATVTVMREEGAYIGHVGDSRIYLKSDGSLNRLTKDHSFVQGLVDQGIIQDEEAESHPQKNQILKALGIREDVDATVCDSPIQLKVGDTLLMCSDGLSGLVTDVKMQELVNEKNVQQSAVELINEANKNGGDDNITAAVISIIESPFTVSVFKHFNPVSFNATATVDVSEDMTSETKWYQNTKVMLIAGSSLVVVIAFLTFMLWPNEASTNDKKKNNKNTKIVQVVKNTVKDTIKGLKAQDLKGLQENKTVFLTKNKDTLIDKTYYCEGFDVEIKDGKIHSKASATNVSGTPSTTNKKRNRVSANPTSNGTSNNSSNTNKPVTAEDKTDAEYMEQGFYTVRKNDNLGAISERFGIKQDSLKRWNKIEDPKSDVKLGGKIVLKDPELKE
jgi:LysM repeat protein